MRKNCMADVATLLGVKIDEIFYIDGYKTNEHKITEDGLMYRRDKSDDWIEINEFLSELILGKRQIIKLPYKPISGEPYFTPNLINENLVSKSIWSGTLADEQAYAKGLVFEEEYQARYLANTMLDIALKNMHENQQKEEQIYSIGKEDVSCVW